MNFSPSTASKSCRLSGPSIKSLAGPDVIAFLHVDVNAARDRIFLGGLAVFASDVNLAHALGDFAVRTMPSISLMTAGSLRLARFEQFHDARQTAGDVLGLGGFARDLREHVAGLHFIAILAPSSGRGKA